MKRLINKILFGLTLTGGSLGLHSCGDWLDINSNELAATKTEAGYLFNYAAINYSSKRVGGDPTRKLGAADRLIGSSLLCLEQGVKPAYIAVGAAGAVYRYLNEAGIEQSKEEAAKVLKDVSGLEADSELAGMILDLYAYFLEGEPVAALRRAAQAAKTAGLGKII